MGVGSNELCFLPLSMARSVCMLPSSVSAGFKYFLPPWNLQGRKPLNSNFEMNSDILNYKIMNSGRNSWEMLTSGWQATPFGTKFVIISCLSVYALDLILNDLIFNTLCDEPKRFLSGEVYRILVQQFMHGRLYNLLVSMFSFYFTAIEIEKQIGTIVFLNDAFLKNIVIQIVYIGLCWALSITNEWFLEQPSFGFWNLTIVYLTTKTLFNPDEDIQFMVYGVKVKYCLASMFVVLNVLEPYRVDFAAAFLIAVVEYKCFNGMMFKPGPECLKRIEQSFLFRNYQSRQDFITVDSNAHEFFISQLAMKYEVGSSSELTGQTSDIEKHRPANEISEQGSISENMLEQEAAKGYSQLQTEQ